MPIFRKQQTDVDALVLQALAEVPDLGDPSGPASAVYEMGKLRDEMTAKRAQIIAKLGRCSAVGPMGPGSIVHYDASADAAALLAGADVGTLTAPAEESEYGSLRRQLRAIDAVLGDLPGRIMEADLRIVAEEFERARPALAKVMATIVEEYERLCELLETVNRLDQELGHRGLPLGRRPSLMTGYDMNILFGGNGWPTLSWQISEMRKTWGLPEKGK
jgi:hypothetical protein